MPMDSLWEFGGDFPWPDPTKVASVLSPPASAPFWANGVLFGTGRAAILALLAHGKSTRGWKRLWVPSYFCPRVIETIEQAGWNCPRYPDTPFARPSGTPPHICTGDVVLRMNFFGWRGKEAVRDTAELPCDVIEDHSHDPLGPWARESRAAYCVVSLRKTIPIPDGGWLWSPQDLALPEPDAPSTEHLLAAGFKISGMILKQHFKCGQPITKQHFRDCLLKGEELLGTGTPGGIHPASGAMLAVLSPDTLAQKRRENFYAFHRRLPNVAELPAANHLSKDCTPFCVVLVFNSLAQRGWVKQQLIENNIYPSVLWFLPRETEPQAVDWGNRSLTLHCHYQYSESDMERTADTLDSILKKLPPA
jgi:hypothetical protein